MRALVGGRALGDLNPLHLRGAELVQREAGGRRVAVEQNLCVARAQAAHPWRIALHVDTGQALEHIGDVVVAVLVHFFAAIDLLGNLCTAAQIVVAGLFAQNFYALQTCARRARGGFAHATGNILRNSGRDQDRAKAREHAGARERRLGVFQSHKGVIL